MGTTNWAALRPEIGGPFGVISFTVTTLFAADKLIISTELADHYPDDSYFSGWYAKIIDQTNVGITRRVTAYSAATGQLTVAGANLGVDASLYATVELHRFHPDRMLTYFNRAARDLFPLVGVLRDVRSLVTGQNQRFYTLPSTVERKPLQVWVARRREAASVSENEVVDPSFEDWASATSMTSWALVGAGSTVNQESNNGSPVNYQVLVGNYSARIDVAASTATTLLQTVTPTVGVQGAEANFSIWVYCLTSGRVAARCGSTDGDTHGGTGWELLSATENQSSTATTVSVGVSVTSGAVIAAYVDEAILMMGQSERFTDNWEPLNNWTYTPQVAGFTSGGLTSAPTLEVREPLSSKHMLRIVYAAPLNVITTDASTVEIDGDVLQVVISKARAYMAQQAANDSPFDERDFWITTAASFNREAAGMLDRGVSSASVPQTHKLPGA